MKTARPFKGDGEWRKHRDKFQKRFYWKRERQFHRKATKQLEANEPNPQPLATAGGLLLNIALALPGPQV